MAYTALTPDSGSKAEGYTQNGNITGVQIISVSDQRIGSRQPLFAQTGRRAEVSNITLMKTLTTSLSAALTERNKLEAMAGQRVVVNSQHGERIEIFCHNMIVQVKAGPGKWLVMANMSCEAMPITNTGSTTP